MVHCRAFSLSLRTVILGFWGGSSRDVVIKARMISEGWWLRSFEHFPISLRCENLRDFEGCLSHCLLWFDSLGFSCPWMRYPNPKRNDIYLPGGDYFTRIPCSSRLAFWSCSLSSLSVRDWFRNCEQFGIWYWSTSCRVVYHMWWWLESENHITWLVSNSWSQLLRSWTVREVSIWWTERTIFRLKDFCEIICLAETLSL